VSLLSFCGAPAGRFGTLLAYAGLTTALLISVNAPAFSAHFSDDIAFRAAWITVTQVPLVYFLSTKRGPLNLLTGISYERINWLHRWIGRMLFVCATTHMIIMASSISIVDLMQSPDPAMVIVRYGAGAYVTLTWIAVSSILPFRRRSYRIFHLNHWVCTLVFLGLVGSHVPSYARLPIYVSTAIVAADKCLCALRMLSNNISVRSLNSKSARARKESSRQVLAMGHPVKMTTPFITNSSVFQEESTTVIRLSDVPLSWKPGQHVRLYIPRLGTLEMHPFTPATCSEMSESSFHSAEDDDVENHGLLPRDVRATASEMLLMIKAHSGLTKRLLAYHAEWLALPCPNASRSPSSLTAYIDGPYGDPIAWENYGKIVLIASSTGVAFPLSILDYLEQLCCNGTSRVRTQQIHLVWTNRHIEPHFEATVSSMLSRHTTMLRQLDINLEASFYTTCAEASAQEAQQRDPFAHLRQPRPKHLVRRPLLRIRNPNAPVEREGERYGEEEEYKLGQVPSCVGASSRRSSYETCVSSTLVGDDSEDSDLDFMLEELDSSCWSRMSSLRRILSEKRLEYTKTCRCADIRHDQKKFRPNPLPEYISWSYGHRPDVDTILSTSIPRTGTERTIVVVCSNQSVTKEVKTGVSKVNMDFARGQREAGVEMHTEEFA
jgi:hypothetical protein